MAPLAVFLSQEPRSYLIVVMLFSTVALLKHIPNMKRLVAGTEPTIGSRNQRNEHTDAEVKEEEVKGQSTTNPVEGRVKRFDETGERANEKAVSNR